MTFAQLIEAAVELDKRIRAQRNNMNVPSLQRNLATVRQATTDIITQWDCERKHS